MDQVNQKKHGKDDASYQNLSENSVRHHNDPYITCKFNITNFLVNDNPTAGGKREEHKTTNKTETSPENKNSSYYNPKNTYNKLNQSSTREKFQHLIEAYDNEPKNENNESMRKVDMDKQKNAMKKCIFLYEKGKVRNEVNRLMFKKNYELKVKQELDNCTFKPKINRNYKQIASQKFFKQGENTNAYDKNVYWKSRSIEK